MRNSKLAFFAGSIVLPALIFFLPDFSSAEGSATPAAESQSKSLNTPREEMKLTIDELVKVVTQNQGDEKRPERREAMRQVIEPKFDFDEMARRSLGTHWNSITVEDQNEFVRLFSELLARTYLNRIEHIEENMVAVTDERVQAPRALVRTKVTFKGDDFPIDYRLLEKDGAWRVYDVVIENIGLVANYRNEFAGIIRKEKFAGLLERLREKIGKATEEV